MLFTGIEELTEKSISNFKFFIKYLNNTEYFEDVLILNNSNKEAEKFLITKIEESLDSLATKFNFFFHNIAN